MLVTAEVALSLVLLAGVGLMLQSFWNLVGVDTGIASDQVVHVTFDWPLGPLSKYQTEAETRQLLNLMSDRVEVIPGVTAFSLSGFVPLSGQELSGGDGVHITMVDRPRPEAGARFRAETRLVSPGFFRALGIPLIEGRTWEAQYIAPKLRAREECACRNPPDPSWQLVPQEVVISVGMARTFWPGDLPHVFGPLVNSLNRC